MAQFTILSLGKNASGVILISVIFGIDIGSLSNATSVMSKRSRSQGKLSHCFKKWVCTIVAIDL
jgi:hypothetical protein